MKRKLTVLAISAMMIMTVLISAPAVIGGEASGSADVGNAAPEIISMTVENNAADDINTPESYFLFKVTVRDNNSLADIDNVIVMVYENSLADTDADNKENHYTFWFDPSDNSWHSSPATNAQGDNFIDIDSSSYPDDLTDNADNYVFRILINGTAAWDNDWNAYAKVDDGTATDTSESANEFGVGVYIAYTLDVSTLEWSALSVPSTNNACDNNTDNPMVTGIETNVSFDVRNKMDNWSYSTYTIGADNTSFYKTDTVESEITMDTDYKDVHTAVGEGEALTENIYYWLDIPTATPKGLYQSTFYIEVVETG